MSIVCNQLNSSSVITSSATNNNFIVPTTTGTSGQFLISNGSGTTGTWTTINLNSLFNQSLNTTNTPSFTGLSVGGSSIPTTAGSTTQYLGSQSGSNATWSIPKTNVVMTTTTTSVSVTGSGNLFSPTVQQFSALSVTITPLATTSKILLMVNLGSISCQNSSGSLIASSTIYRGATNLVTTNTYSGIFTTETTGLDAVPCTYQYIDTPTTTSAITYNVYVASGGSSSYSAVFNNTNCLASIIAYEI
jgi:hypothetical protein